VSTTTVDKGLVDPAALDAIVATYETQVGPHNGARVVAARGARPATRRACSMTLRLRRSAGLDDPRMQEQPVTEDAPSIANLKPSCKRAWARASFSYGLRDERCALAWFMNVTA
jgi:nitrile hydratase subunit alpha